MARLPDTTPPDFFMDEVDALLRPARDNGGNTRDYISAWPDGSLGQRLNNPTWEESQEILALVRGGSSLSDSLFGPRSSREKSNLLGVALKGWEAIKQQLEIGEEKGIGIWEIGKNWLWHSENITTAWVVRYIMEGMLGPWVVLKDASPHSELANQHPLLQADEYEALRESIGKRGQHQPIIVNEAGEILDGRHREAACLELGIEPNYVKYDGPEEKNRIQSYIMDLNMIHRNATPSQKAAYAVKYVIGKPDMRRVPNKKISGTTSYEEASKTVGVGRNTVMRAHRLYLLDNEQFEAVARGEATATAALAEVMPSTSTGHKAISKAVEVVERHLCPACGAKHRIRRRQEE